jgi:hypothetical protein
MAVCPFCGHHNRPGSLICEQCLHNLYNSALNGIPSTKQLGNLENIPKVTNIGHSWFDPNDRLVIQIRDSREPIILKNIDRVIMGRAGRNGRREPDIDLTPYDAMSKGVSHMHISIGYQGNALAVMDMGSLNGTYLNGERLIANREYVLHDGDELLLGELVIHTYFQQAVVTSTD